MNRLYPLVAERASHRCECCYAPEVIFNFAFEVEHVVPPPHGGTDHEANLALACRGCNLHKSGHLDGPDVETQATARPFHPRRDEWTVHFSVVAGTGEIVGRTPVGRATVARLQMNTPTQLAARSHWMRLRLFP